MPIVRAGPELIYFAHVPKCAGTAVESYLTERFGPPAFLDRRHNDRPPRRRWTRSSPQHVTRAHLDRLFPPGFFDAAFAVLRHPLDRIVSAYLFALEVEETVAAGTSFGAWLEAAQAARRRAPFAFDNHVRPMDDFVPRVPDAALFRLEDGLAPVVAWLDARAGGAQGPREMPRLQHRSSWRVRKRLAPRDFRASPGERALVAGLYAVDFARFGYDPDGPTRY